jgi:hypothetical protein
LIPFRLRPALLVLDDRLTLDRPAVVRAAEDRPILFPALGATLIVITVPDSALEPLREDEVLCARALAAA